MEKQSKLTEDPNYKLAAYLSLVDEIDLRTPEVEVKFHTVKDSRDFPELFKMHYTEYLQKNRNSTPVKYKDHTVNFLQSILQVLTEKYKGINKVPNVIWAKKYLKYLNTGQYLIDYQQGRGIDGILRPNELKALYIKMKGKYIKAREADFVAALTNEPLKDFRQIVWIDKSETGTNTGKSNRITLRAFIEVIKGGDSDYPDTVYQYDVSKFKDMEGETMKLNKRKNDAFHRRNLNRFRALLENLEK